LVPQSIFEEVVSAKTSAEDKKSVI